MLDSAPAKKVIVHVGEDHTYRGRSAFSAILEYLIHKKVSTANATRGIAGFGADHHLHTTAIECLTANLPIQIEFVDSSEKVDEVMPTLSEMAGSGLIEMQDTVLSIVSTGVPFVEEKPLTARRKEAKAQLMRIFIDENDEWEDKPLHQALVECMRVHEMSGATVYQGVQGYGENGKINREQLHSRYSAHPIIIAVIESEDKIRDFLPFLDHMVQGGLVVLSDVETIRYTHDFHSADRRATRR